MPTVNDDIQAHIENTDNPHQVSKADVGLELIENYPIATQDEAIAGEVNERYITPYTLKYLFNGLLRRRGLMDEKDRVIYV
jgi:hypothetical protein